MNRLDEILRAKQAEIEQLRPFAAELRKEALLRNDFRGFRAALKRPDKKVAVIAEVKKASPSAGVIRESFQPVEIARGYESSGADAISVLTDEKFFQGKLDDLREIRQATRLPVLRKDFVLDEVQIAEAVAAGADAILLIVAALTPKRLTALLATASDFQVDALVEVHTLEELDRALEAGAEIIGINNRNLATFEVDLAATEKISGKIPDHIVLVSESGIRSPADIARVESYGVDAVLVGEALMRGSVSVDGLKP